MRTDELIKLYIEIEEELEKISANPDSYGKCNDYTEYTSTVIGSLKERQEKIIEQLGDESGLKNKSGLKYLLGNFYSVYKKKESPCRLFF